MTLFVYNEKLEVGTHALHAKFSTMTFRTNIRAIHVDQMFKRHPRVAANEL